MANTLVVYYSRKGENHMPGGIQVLEKGHTAFAAEFIAEALGADLFEIDTVKPYAANYRECCMEAVQEAKSGARPEIKGFVPSIEGSGLANAPRDIAAACAGAVLGEGLSVRGHQVKDNRETIVNWAKSQL